MSSGTSQKLRATPTNSRRQAATVSAQAAWRILESMPPIILIRIAIAGVWLYEGLWCKILARAPQQAAVVAAHPLFSPERARLVLLVIGVVEVALAVWVLTGLTPVLAALAQTVLLVGMNANGLLFARHEISDPGGMVVKNFAFLVLGWVAAGYAGG